MSPTMVMGAFALPTSSTASSPGPRILRNLRPVSTPMFVLDLSHELPPTGRIRNLSYCITPPTGPLATTHTSQITTTGLRTLSGNSSTAVKISSVRSWAKRVSLSLLTPLPRDQEGCYRWYCHCMSSCALFSLSYIYTSSLPRAVFLTELNQITMGKLEGAKTVVLGGRNTVKRQYCGTVGGQSTSLATINSRDQVGQTEEPPLVSTRPPYQHSYGTVLL